MEVIIGIIILVLMYVILSPKETTKTNDNLEEILDPKNHKEIKLSQEQEIALVHLCISKCAEGETLADLVKEYGEENIINSCYNQITSNTIILADSYMTAHITLRSEEIIKSADELVKNVKDNDVDSILASKSPFEDDTNNEDIYKKQTHHIVYKDLNGSFDMFLPVLDFIEDKDVKEIAEETFKTILKQENLSFDELKEEFNKQQPISLLIDSEKLKKHIKDNAKWKND